MRLKTHYRFLILTRRRTYIPVMPLVLGFTGSRYGLTPMQFERLRKAILHFQPTEFHHGSATGADSQAHLLVRELFPSCRTHAHPSTSNQWRIEVEADVTYESLPPLERNPLIIAPCNVVIGCPREMLEQPRGGTWTTLRLARDAGKETYIIRVDGSVVRALKFLRPLPNRTE